MRLALDGITAGYGATTVLRNVSLVVPDGKVVALLGPNGAGKSTTLSVASGLIAPTAGRVELDHADVSGEAPQRLVARGLCHITEGGSVFPGLTVGDNLRMFAHDDGAVPRAVEAFPILGERLAQTAGTLSGGEQRMLALARAYAQQASVVLVDEVSLGLAPIIVNEIFAHLAKLAADGVSLLIVEQYVAKVLEIADLVYVLVRGRVAFVGEPAELEGTEILAHYLGVEGRLRA